MDNPRQDTNFGNGEVGGDNRWSAPVHGTTADGQPVTASFGQGGRDGHTLVSDGHVTGEQFYGPGGHDHYGPQGQHYADRGAYQRPSYGS